MDRLTIVAHDRFQEIIDEEAVKNVLQFYEQRLAVLLDGTVEVEKWARLEGPPPRIDWGHGSSYEPDFVAETTSHKYLIETKAANEMQDAEVQAKALAAATWCRHATAYAATHGGKPWTYVLIPHDEVTASATLSGLAVKWSVGAPTP